LKGTPEEGGGFPPRIKHVWEEKPGKERKKNSKGHREFR